MNDLPPPPPPPPPGRGRGQRRPDESPRSHGGGNGKVYFGTQIEKAPPTFMLSVNDPRFFARNYLRYLNNQIRQRYSFTGNRIFIRTKSH